MFNPTPSLRSGAHACHFYTTASEQKGFALPFIREGLENGEFCLFIVPESAIDDWMVELQAHGIDVIEARRAGALEIMEAEDWRDSGPFTSLSKARQLLRFLNQKLRSFKGVRIIGDADWEGDPPIAADLLCHWEATANLVFDGLNVRAVCQYDLLSYSPETLHAAIRTHAQVVSDCEVFDNPHYEGPAILQHEPELNECSHDRELVKRLLAEILTR